MYNYRYKRNLWTYIFYIQQNKHYTHIRQIGIPKLKVFIYYYNIMVVFWTFKLFLNIERQRDVKQWHGSLMATDFSFVRLGGPVMNHLGHWTSPFVGYLPPHSPPVSLFFCNHLLATNWIVWLGREHRFMLRYWYNVLPHCKNIKVRINNTSCSFGARKANGKAANGL